jgi:hypothetical protein
MKLARILLILFMGGIVFFMVSCPPLYDSTRSFEAHWNFFTNRSDANWQAVKEAKRQDRVDMIKLECVFVGILILSGYAFRRAGIAKHDR